MTAAWMWARAELRARWKAWILLGLLAGATVGVAAAGFAGARRTANAVPDMVAAGHVPERGHPGERPRVRRRAHGHASPRSRASPTPTRS